jgi:hypothetical protein
LLDDATTLTVRLRENPALLGSCSSLFAVVAARIALIIEACIRGTQGGIPCHKGSI